MAVYSLGILTGDGIGPEIMRATVQVIDAALQGVPDLQIAWVPLPMGWEAINATGSALPESTKAALHACAGWLMGPHDSASYPVANQQERNPSGELRHTFDLYANVRPAQNYPTLRAVVQGTDLIIVRENTEEFYPDRNMYQGMGEFMPTPDMALTIGVFTRRAAERIAHVACRLARERRQHLTIVHKANVIKAGMGLFKRTCQDVARTHYPDVTVDDYHVDAMAALLVRRPADFDVIVTTNMLGDILSDLAAELVGSLGLAPSLNSGATHAMAQAAHGSAPDIAGQDRANPIGLMLSATMLLRWLGTQRGDQGLVRVATQIADAITRTLHTGIATPDLGGTAGTDAFTTAVLGNLIQ